MKQRHMTSASLFVLIAALPGLALGQQTAEPAASAQVSLSDLGGAEGGDTPLDKRAKLGLVLGGKVGGGIGAPFSEFGASPVAELEIGFLLPLPAPVGRSIELFITGQYTQPTVDGRVTKADPRLPGDGVLEYEVTQQELALTFGALYRIPLSTDLLMPYGALGGRMYLLKTKVTGSGGGEAYGDNEETASEFGFYAALGVDFFVGPGAILAEVQMGYAALDGFVMRNTNVGALNLAVGYRLML